MPCHYCHESLLAKQMPAFCVISLTQARIETRPHGLFFNLRNLYNLCNLRLPSQSAQSPLLLVALYYFPNDPGGGDIVHKRYPHHLPAPGLHKIRPYDLIFTPVCAFHQAIRLQALNDM